ncbi:checkpoint suppressor 1 [Chanos chanos]|uniref:Forkhead box protein N3 n=1 Tax=Chanos chanos TaxID=29144 RepID=A0A6J2V6L1_CHACN|nr:forkhead box protein N3-like [Chanos chanos]
MGPIMPPGKKAEGPGGGSMARGLGTLCQEAAEAADLSLALSASLSRAEDEELTSLSWLHESTDLLTSLGHPGLRSVSPVQDGSGTADPASPSSSSSSPEPETPYRLSMGASRKPPYSFSCLIFMAIEDAPAKRLPVKDIYGWILEHFPYFASAPTGWKNSVRHNLSLNKCFKKVDKDRSQAIGKGSLWSIDPEYRHNLIQALKKTPYHPYSPRLATPPTSAATPPQAYHSPHLWPGSPLYRKNGGVLLQVPQRVIQHGSRVSTQNLFPVIRTLPFSPSRNRTTTIRSTLGDYLTQSGSGVKHDSPPSSDDLQEDHTYSSAQSPGGTQQVTATSSSSSSSSCSSQGSDPSCADGEIIEVQVTEIKQEPGDFPLDATTTPFQQSQRNGSRKPPWMKGRQRTPGDTLPLKKRRAEKPPESDDDDDKEMKEAAGSLLHLAGVRACLNKMSHRTSKGQKEQREAVRD